MSKAEPFGFYKDEQGNKLAIPDQLDALKQAEYYIKQGCTMRSVRDWLVQKTGRDISTPGLLKAIRYDKTKKNAETATN
jgi:hypothetical protein